MRCPDCSKFVSFDQQEPEIEADLDGETVTGTVRLVLACAECGGELKEANLDFEADVDHECGNEEYEITDTSGDVNDRYETTDKNGKPISPRYQKHYYGADISITVHCSGCDEDIAVSALVEEQASGFDELV